MATNNTTQSIEELELHRDDLISAQQTIMAQRSELKEKAVKVQAQIDEVTAAIEAKKKLERMSDTEKRALMQQIEAEGIESQEAVDGF